MDDDSRMPEQRETHDQNNNPFRLSVLGRDGTLKQYDAHGSLNVRSLSEEIAKKQGVAVDDQVLTSRGTDRIFNGCLLYRTVTLSDLGIDKDTILVLSRKSDDPTTLEVIVSRTWDPMAKCLYLKPTDKIESIARRIENLEGVGMDEAGAQLRVSYKGKQVYAGGHKVDGLAPSEITLQSIGAANDPFPRLVAHMVVDRGSSCRECVHTKGIKRV